MKFHNLIRAGNYPNCSMMARKFRVHLRTVNRDVQFMRDRLGLPLEYDPGKRGFYYTRRVDQFPAMPITESEIFALLVAHKAIEQYQGTPFERPLMTAFRKISGQLDQQMEYSVGNPDELLSFRPVAPETADVENFEILTRALRQKRVLRFEYRKLGAEAAEERVVHPYHLACIENHWYLFAFDVNRKDMRTFVLTRLSDPEIMPGQFTISKAFNLNEHLKGAFAVFKGKGNYEVVIEFDRWATDLMRGRRWHWSQEITELPGGCSRLRLRLDNLEEIVGWVLGWGPHATVIGPADLVKRVGASAKAIMEKCGVAAREAGPGTEGQLTPV